MTGRYMHLLRSGAMRLRTVHLPGCGDALRSASARLWVHHLDGDTAVLEHIAATASLRGCRNCMPEVTHKPARPARKAS